MRARILQKVDDTYLLVWSFLCEPGIEMIYENMRINVEVGDNDSVDNYKIGINDTWNPFCVFETDIDSYQFPLILNELDSLDGTIKILVPATLTPGQYAKHLQLFDIDAEGLPIFGRLLFGTGVFELYAYDNIDASILPVIRTTIKAGVNVPVSPGGFASNAEKLAVINVLVDWLNDVENPYQAAFNAIADLDENSTAEEIYQAYLLTKDFVLYKIPAVTLNNAVLSIQNEVLG